MKRIMEQAGITDIAEKAAAGERLSFDDGVRLFKCGSVHAVGGLAHEARMRKNGKKAFYIVNFHINYSNVCRNRCRFCAFSRTKGSPGAYTMSVDEILDAARTAHPDTTEFHIVGGCHPEEPFEYYEEMITRLHAEFPDVHLQAFTAVEIANIAHAGGMSAADTLVRLRDAGLGSLPGGGAEIFDKGVREKICPEKLPSDEWLSVAREAHKLGVPSNATMLYGTIETVEHRVDHLVRLRELQDETHGFMSFIPLPFHPENTRMSDLSPTSAKDDLMTIAVSRLMLDNFDHVKAFWIMLTARLAQVSLFYGADDLDGTVVREKITHSAGAQTPEELTRDEFVHLADEAGFVPTERDTVYNEIVREAAN